jgi:hypothetical protein
MPKNQSGRTADPEFSSRSTDSGWIKACATFGQKGENHVGPAFGNCPRVVAGLRSIAALGPEPASNLARSTVPRFVQSRNCPFRISCSQSHISVELTR